MSVLSFGQILNDSSFDASISRPKYKKQVGPSILIDAGHHNFIVEMGLIKPFVDLSYLYENSAQKVHRKVRSFFSFGTVYINIYSF